MNKKNIIKNTISFLIIFITLALAIFYISKHLKDFKQIALINPLWIIPLVVIVLINYFFIGLQTKVLLEPLGVKLKQKEAYMLSIVTGFYNLITPARGGTAIRAVYLKKEHGFTYTNFLSSLAGMYVITFFVGSLSGLISLFFIEKFYGVFNWLIFFMFLGFFIPLLFIITFAPTFKEKENKFFNYVIKVANGWNIIRKNKKVIKTCIFVTTYGLLSGIVLKIILFYIFGIQISFIQALFLASISTLSILVQITPAGLGITEIIVVFSALVIGITPIQSIPVVILGRIIQLISLFSLGPIFSYILFKQKPKNEKPN